MIVSGEPVTSVKVMLVNLDAKADSSNYANNRTAFVDSALTGADGTYAITGIAPGRLGVIPVFEDTTTTYTYSLAWGGSGEFTVNGDARTADFITEKTNVPGADSEQYEIKLTFIHLPTSSLDIISHVHVTQREWALFIPVWKDNADEEFGFSTYRTTETITIKRQNGWTCLAYTLDNYFKVEGHKLYFEFGHPLSNTPAYSEFGYDHNTKKVTRTK